MGSPGGGCNYRKKRRGVWEWFMLRDATAVIGFSVSQLKMVTHQQSLLLVGRTAGLLFHFGDSLVLIQSQF